MAKVWRCCNAKCPSRDEPDEEVSEEKHGADYEVGYREPCIYCETGCSHVVETGGDDE